jgi:hypothetical protein
MINCSCLEIAYNLVSANKIPKTGINAPDCHNVRINLEGEVLGWEDMQLNIHISQIFE